MSVSEEYKVSLEVYEGPLDLLLYLIRKDEIDIADIPIGRITGQYMQYLDLMRMLDLNIAGEFLVMAATLMMIKSRMLLPADERPVDVEEEPEADPRWDLVRQLVEYKKFKDAALFLQEIEGVREGVFARGGDAVQLGERPDSDMDDVGLFDLLSALNAALSRTPKEDLRDIFSERYTVAEKLDILIDLMRREARVSMHRIFAGMRSRHEIVVTFLAMLELIRLKQVAARQHGPFEDIVIERVEAA
ncbi:MAG: segregation/condensation protein A [Kiritimatiellia bacterium]|nr:segregation/condensation protein A [Kiritimatiellia bacterium]